GVPAARLRDGALVRPAGVGLTAARPLVLLLQLLLPAPLLGVVPLLGRVLPGRQPPAVGADRRLGPAADPRGEPVAGARVRDGERDHPRRSRLDFRSDCRGLRDRGASHPPASARLKEDGPWSASVCRRAATPKRGGRRHGGRRPMARGRPLLYTGSRPWGGASPRP